MAKNAFLKIISIFIIILVGVAILFFYNPKTIDDSNPSVQPPEDQPKTTTLFFAGDIMLSRNVAGRMIKNNDYAFPFRQVGSIIAQSDIAMANLESPFNNTGDYFVEGTLVFNADPRSVEGLKLAGFDLLSTANNHSFDQGLKGLEFTLDHLRTNNIIPVGTQKPGEDNPAVISHNGIAYGFLAYSYTAYNDGGKSTHPQIKNFNDIEQLEQDVLNMKGHYADVVIVNMHAGTEYERLPGQQQIDFAHAAIDAGADLVIGHHPHWIQTIEVYKGKYIFYSLGNFVFDQMWSQDTREGLTVFVTYENRHLPDPTGQTAGEDRLEIVKIELKPIIIDDYCCPRWADEEETKTILNKVNPATNTGIMIDNGVVSDSWKNITFEHKNIN